MKLRLSVHQKPINGFTNIDPVPLEPGAIVQDIKNLSNINDNSCTEIILDKCLEFVPFTQMEQFITLVVSKLRHKGKLYIISSDIREVIRCYYTDRINLRDMNKVLYGELNHPWDNKVSILSLNDVADLLKMHGLQIVGKELDGIYFIIKAIRP